MDFTSPMAIGARLNEVDGGGVKGYDHCYVLNPRTDPLKQMAARVEDPDTGRDAGDFHDRAGNPALHGQSIDGKAGGRRLQAVFGPVPRMPAFSGFAESAKIPLDVLEPNKPYTQTTIHRFSVKYDQESNWPGRAPSAQIASVGAS